MLSRLAHLAAATLIGVMLLAALYALTQVPLDHPIAIHFDASGTPNGWAPAWRGLLLVPALGAVVWGVLALLPRIDPRGQNLLRSGPAVATIGLTVLAVLAAGQVMIATEAVGVHTPLVHGVAVVVGLLFAGIGNVMGKLRWNYTVGIRTPWTLANERVWDKTHRFGGRLSVAVGAAMALSPFLPAARGHQLGIVMAGALLIVLLPILRSYQLWQQESRTSA